MPGQSEDRLANWSSQYGITAFARQLHSGIFWHWSCICVDKTKFVIVTNELCKLPPSKAKVTK